MIPVGDRLKPEIDGAETSAVNGFEPVVVLGVGALLSVAETEYSYTPSAVTENDEEQLYDGPCMDGVGQSTKAPGVKVHAGKGVIEPPGGRYLNERELSATSSQTIALIVTTALSGPNGLVTGFPERDTAERDTILGEPDCETKTEWSNKVVC